PSGGAAFRASGFDPLTGDFQDGFGEPVEVEIADLGIPSEIKVVMPHIPDIRVIHDVPALIKVEMPKIPDIKIIGPDVPLPSEIRVVNAGIPQSIELVATKVPESIKLDATGVPRSIKLELP